MDFYCVAWTNRLLGEYIIIVYTWSLWWLENPLWMIIKWEGFYLNRTFCSGFSVLYLLKFLLLFFLQFYFLFFKKKSYFFVARFDFFISLEGSKFFIYFYARNQSFLYTFSDGFYFLFFFLLLCIKTSDARVLKVV